MFTSRSVSLRDVFRKRSVVKGIMARRRGLSCNDILACLDVLSDVDSEHEVDIEDSLSWDESDPESEEVSDSYKCK